MATGVIVFFGICWVLVIKALHSNLYEYLQSVQGYLSPAIAVLFIFGVFWKRATATAALWSFIVGIVAGFARLAADLIMKDDGATVKALKQQLYQGTITQEQYTAGVAPIHEKFGLLFTFWDIHWLYFSEILFVLTAALMIIISLVTKAPDPKTVRFTYYGATTEEKAITRASWSAVDVVLSALVVAICVVFYISFF